MKTIQVASLLAVMRRGTSGAVLLSASLLAACGGGGSDSIPLNAPPEPQVTNVRPGTWVVMGSSTAAGASVPPGKGWVELLQLVLADRGVQFANIAKGGTMTYHGLSTMVQAVPGRPLPDPAANIDQALLRKPMLLIVSYPSNDTALGYSSDETVNNIASIRNLALASGVPVIVVSSQPRKLTAVQLDQLQSIDQRLATSIGACFVDVRTALAAADGQLVAAYDAGDGVHPNEAGHLLIAAKVQETVESGMCVRLVP